MVGTRFYGRLGNVLFQTAHTIALALKNGQEFSVPNKTNDPFWNPLYLQHLVNPKYIQGKEDVLINEHGMRYQEIKWDDSWKDKQVVLNGYWQTEKYFKDYRGEVVFLFGFPYSKREGVVSVHVRRGDYLLHTAKHPYYGKDWYERAMSLFPGKMFKFFSDDLKWCKDNFGDRGDCIFSTNTNEIDDLIEISCCESNINSSSTFSWWGSWLNQNPDKIVITPELWFTPGWDGYDTSDIVPETWVKL